MCGISSPFLDLRPRDERAIHARRIAALLRPRLSHPFQRFGPGGDLIRQDLDRLVVLFIALESREVLEITQE
jgi:hypothetical protein